jgi:hypothetical protein
MKKQQQIWCFVWNEQKWKKNPVNNKENQPESRVNCQDFFNIICGEFVCVIWIVRGFDSHDTA